MGLLDDAIREHLELKRLRGADPGEVAQEEHDALGPVRHVAEQDDTSGEVEPSVWPDGPLPAAASRDLSESATGQETLEINMEAELRAKAGGGEIDEPAEQGGNVSATPGGNVSAVPGRLQPRPPLEAQDSLEWEVPGSGADDEPAQSSDIEAEGDEPVEDVLEETPDFLRETPEHERLWFEQRPPRDFDFNE